MADTPTKPGGKPPTQTISRTGGVKIGGKKVPPAAIVLIGAAVIVGLLVYRKKATSGGSSEESGELGRQAFVPVTAENVGGVGAGGGGLTSTSGSEFGQLLSQEQSNNEWLANFLNEQKQENHTFYETIHQTLTGGGAPTGTTAGGVVSAPPEGGATSPGKGNPAPPQKPSSPSPVVSPKNITCGNGCPGHEYPKGKNGKGSKVVECMTKQKGKCQWP